MIKPENWEKVEPAKEFGEFESLKLGGHECVIKSAVEYTGMTGNTSLQICVDIAGNDEQKGFFQRQFDDNKNSDKRWPSGAIKYISLKEDDQCVAMFKGFITTLENSNNNFKWEFDESKLVGLKLAGVWGLEEYQNDKGETKTATKLTQFRSLDKLKEIKVPKVKTLDGQYIAYDEYMSGKRFSVTIAKGIFNNVTTDETDDLPFEL
jgi:hypothetical protein